MLRLFEHGGFLVCFMAALLMYSCLLALQVGLGPCSQVLDDITVRQLGVGAQCVWRDARQLMVHMTPDYTLRPGSEITIKPFTLRGELENDDPASGSIQVCSDTLSLHSMKALDNMITNISSFDPVLPRANCELR